MLRTFLARRRKAIRREVFSVPEYRKLKLSFDAWLGLASALPFVLTMRNAESTLTIALFAVPAAVALIYAAFAIYVQWKAYSEWGDRVFDRITKKSLSKEYQASESATSAERKRRKGDNQ